MANIKSSAKRAEIGERNRVKNKSVKTSLKSIEKKLDVAIAEKDVNLSEEVLKEAVKKYDTAAAKGVIHKNAANKKKSSMQTKVNAIKS
ncbi:MAG: 30S ribosomal protein S20 [Eubacteriaceae bacterium]|jgi:small subunit ribosomal protein S20|nr:30S ribosomal protein S20 [Eubacteriaceae bacterium]